MNAPVTTLELITNYIDDIAPVNPTAFARLTEFLVKFSAFLCLYCLFFLSDVVKAGEATESKNKKLIQYPHLYSNTINGKEPCSLQPEDVKWLESKIKEGKLRVATQQDINKWETKAKKLRDSYVKVHMDCGRTFTVLDKLVIPDKLDNGVNLSDQIVFIVLENVPFPKPYQTGSTFYDLETGGWYALGQYNIGNTSEIGVFPRYKPELY